MKKIITMIGWFAISSLSSNGLEHIKQVHAVVPGLSNKSATLTGKAEPALAYDANNLFSSQDGLGMNDAMKNSSKSAVIYQMKNREYDIADDQLKLAEYMYGMVLIQGDDTKITLKKPTGIAGGCKCKLINWGCGINLFCALNCNTVCRRSVVPLAVKK